MKASVIFSRFAIGASLVLLSAAATADTYQFKFLANPDAIDPTQDKALDVLHTITIDSSKISSFSSQTLGATSAWMSGGIQMTMTHGGKTVSLNDGLDPTSSRVSIPGAYGYDEGFISLGSSGIWFFAMEFAPGNAFIDSHNLPYDPFVYGFLFAYQDNKAYQDFRSLWLNGDTSVLSSYRVSQVPEPGTMGLALVGALGALTACRKKRATS